MDKALITMSTSLFSNSRMTCRYISCVVFMLACPSRLETLAIETPANSKSEAWVCLNPCIEITGTPACLQCRARIPLAVELYTLPSTKIGLSPGKFFNRIDNYMMSCQSSCTLRTEEAFFVGTKPPPFL